MARVDDLMVKIKMESFNYRGHIAKIAANDADVVIEKDEQYGASWCKRGGTGAYHVFIRKFDRLEEFAQHHNYNIFEAIAKDPRPEGVIDDIRDIRGYLLLIEAYAIENGLVTPRYPAEAPQCQERFNGYVCERKLGHAGLHRSSIEGGYNWAGPTQGEVP